MNMQQWQDRLWHKPKRVVFTDGTNPEVLKAARTLAQTGWAKPIIAGHPFRIREVAEQNKIRLQGVSLKKPIHDPDFDRYSRFYRKEVEPGLSYAAAKEKLQQPLWYAVLLIKHGQADLCLAPAQDTVTDLLQLERIFSESEPFVSAATLIWDEKSDRIFLFADTFVNARPDAQQLARIAFDSAQTFRALTDEEARVALLSFSTKGSADHPRVQVVRDALQQMPACCPQVKVEGELQFDAAFVPEILQKKAPDSAFAQAANVFVFPSLSAADPGVKIVQTLTELKTAGPLLQGLQFPVHWILPEANADDIVNQTIVASSLLNA